MCGCLGGVDATVTCGCEMRPIEGLVVGYSQRRLRQSAKRLPSRDCRLLMYACLLRRGSCSSAFRGKTDSEAASYLAGDMSTWENSRALLEI